MDILDFLKKHNREERASFHMPGHKGRRLFERLGYGDVVESLVDYDITEIPGADDLRDPKGAIKGIEDRYSELYSSDKTFISVNGSSACIIAAIKTCVRPGHKLIAASNSHISVKNGAELTGAELVLVTPHKVLGRSIKKEILAGISDVQDTNSVPYDSALSYPSIRVPGSIANKGDALKVELSSKSEESTRSKNLMETDKEPCEVDQCSGVSVTYGCISSEDIADVLDQNPGADAVIVPSPDYLGVMSDISAIAKVVHDRGKILIVDQAHGAHLKFFDSKVKENVEEECPAPATDHNSFSAESQGADIVINSTHKTLASFTQSAIVNLFATAEANDMNCGKEFRFYVERYREELLKLESTSPSYILMASHAINCEILSNHPEILRNWESDLAFFYHEFHRQGSSLGGIELLFDPPLPGDVGNDRGAIIDGQVNDVVDSDKRVVTNSGDAVADAGLVHDPTKIVVKFPSSITERGIDIEKELMKRGVFPEFASGNIVLFMTGIGNVRADYELLLDALISIAGY